MDFYLESGADFNFQGRARCGGCLLPLSIILAGKGTKLMPFGGDVRRFFFFQYPGNRTESLMVA
jgi:hypothetical protein